MQFWKILHGDKVAKNMKMTTYKLIQNAWKL
jgi:hypothetical protein